MYKVTILSSLITATSQWRWCANVWFAVHRALRCQSYRRRSHWKCLKKKKCFFTLFIFRESIHFAVFYLFIFLQKSFFLQIHTCFFPMRQVLCQWGLLSGAIVVQSVIPFSAKKPPCVHHVTSSLTYFQHASGGRRLPTCQAHVIWWWWWKKITFRSFPLLWLNALHLSESKCIRCKVGATYSALFRDLILYFVIFACGLILSNIQ